MKKISKMFLMTAVLTLAWGCSSNDDDEIQPKQETEKDTKPDVVNADSTTYMFTPTAGEPAWDVDWTWHDEAPDWQAPQDVSAYESRMYVCFSVSYDLLPYVSERDKLALFVGDECRGVATPYFNSSYEVYFNVIVLGNHEDSERKTTVMYYCDSMKQLFVLDGFYTFMPDVTVGSDYNLELELGDGSPKYRYSYLTVKIPSTAPVVLDYKDVVAVFINGECRGVGKLHQEFKVWIDKDSDEVDASAIELRFYNIDKGGYYTFPSTTNLELYNYHEMWIFNN